MNRSLPSWLVTTLIVLLSILLAALCIIGGFMISRDFYVVDFRLYPKGQSALDLRNENISLAHFQKLEQKMPDCRFYWNIPVQGETYPSDTAELTVSALTQEDVAALAYFTDLKTVHAEQCSDYDTLLAAAAACPNTEFLYTVPVAGQQVSSADDTICVSALSDSDLENMKYLPKLTTIDAKDCTDPAQMFQIQTAHPEWDVLFPITIAGVSYSTDAQELTLSNVSFAEIETSLGFFSQLRSVTLESPNFSGAEYVALEAKYPDVDFSMQITCNGKTFDENTTELDISGTPITVEEAKQLAAPFPKLEKLIMTDCGIDNETMAAFREEMRSQYKVVWTVYLSDKCKVRTDEIYFYPIQQGEYYLQDKHTHDLRYCEDLIVMDVGHMTIRNVDFLAFMPKLKYLILAWTEVSDISPIVNCTELIHLQLDCSSVKDFSPLTALTKLEDLNISSMNRRPDIEPITKLTSLKNLWMLEWNTKAVLACTEALPNTRIQAAGQHTCGYGWRQTQNYYDMRDILGASYMN